jgi:membrane associated rhomboid family serine protease
MLWTLLFVNAAVFFFELQLSGAQVEQFFYRFGLVPARYSHAAWARWAGLSIDDYWWAHIGGFVAGAVLLGVFVRPERPYQADEYGIERAFMRG